MDEQFTTELTKWPGFLVEGDPVSSDQAAEIIVRTSGLDFITNDHAFARELYAACGIAVHEEVWPSPTNWEQARMVRDRLGVLDLTYLQNSQIVSSWIGGPHGWCAWDGTIAAGNYNIGKWPSVEEVLEDWQAIAAAFPYLRLRSQLLSDEGCVEDVRPVVEFTVANGQATAGEPGATIRFDGGEPDILKCLTPGGERGCTIEQFRAALALAERQVAPR